LVPFFVFGTVKGKQGLGFKGYMQLFRQSIIYYRESFKSSIPGKHSLTVFHHVHNDPAIGGWPHPLQPHAS
jgi:hypothetical protein